MGIMLDIGKRSYELKYTINAICEFERESGRSVGEAFEDPGVSTLRDLFWAGITGAGEKISRQEAGRLMEEFFEDGGNADVFIKAMTDAFAQSGFFGKSATK